MTGIRPHFRGAPRLVLCGPRCHSVCARPPRVRAVKYITSMSPATRRAFCFCLPTNLYDVSRGWAGSRNRPRNPYVRATVPAGLGAQPASELSGIGAGGSAPGSTRTRRKHVPHQAMRRADRGTLRSARGRGQERVWLPNGPRVPTGHNGLAPSAHLASARTIDRMAAGQPPLPQAER